MQKICIALAIWQVLLKWDSRDQICKKFFQGIESDIELKIIPRYTSSSGKIRLLKRLARGEFGVVWKAKDMIRLENIDEEPEKYMKRATMVRDEAATMQLMTHERNVKLNYFESASLSIVLE